MLWQTGTLIPAYDGLQIKPQTLSISNLNQCSMKWPWKAGRTIQLAEKGIKESISPQNRIQYAKDHVGNTEDKILANIKNKMTKEKRNKWKRT